MTSGSTPLPLHSPAEGSPSPLPLPSAGEGSPSTPLPLPSAGEGRGEGVPPLPGHDARLAAAQPLSAKARVMLRHRADPAKRNEHFLKYNLGSSTYDERYARQYGEEYLTYLQTWIEKAADARADLLLLPEFAFVPAVLAGPGPGIPPNPRAVEDAVRLYMWSAHLFRSWLSRWCLRTGMLVGAALPTARNGKLYNTGMLLDEKGRLALSYDKVHLPMDEADHFTPGREYATALTRIGRVGFAICYDMAYPEGMACLAREGVDLVLHPSGGFTLPDEPPDMGLNRLRVRASDHHCAILYASFAPAESGGPGGSCVVASNGSVADAGPGADPGLACGAVRLGGKRQWPGDAAAAPDRQALRRSGRRPETYAGLC